MAVRSLATTVTGPVPSWLPSVGLHESYGICTQGPHNRTTLAKSQSCKILKQRFRGHAGQKMYQADGGLFEQPTYVAHYSTVLAH
jgi:hypothetical protein